MDHCRCRVIRQASSSLPSAVVRPLMTPRGTTQGWLTLRRKRSVLYSRVARSALISLIAMTVPESLTNRTTCREIPRGRAARSSVGQCSNGSDHGRSSIAGSSLAAVISSATRPWWHGRSRRRDTAEGGGVLEGHRHLLVSGAVSLDTQPGLGIEPVSYTHLTLPTNSEV